MTTTKAFLRAYNSNLGQILVIASFFLVFLLLYNPYELKEYYDNMGGFSFSFHFTMLFCIMLVCFAISRLLLTTFNLDGKMEDHKIITWYALEVLAATAFIALYTTLFFSGAQSYFRYLSFSCRNTYTILCFPYLFFWMKGIIAKKNQMLSSEAVQTSLLKLYDEHHRLKLTIDPKAILYCKAESNYYKVCYVEGESVREFILRNSLKSLEQAASGYGITRCHRSYSERLRTVLYMQTLSKTA